MPIEFSQTSMCTIECIAIHKPKIRCGIKTNSLNLSKLKRWENKASHKHEHKIAIAKKDTRTKKNRSKLTDWKKIESESKSGRGRQKDECELRQTVNRERNVISIYTHFVCVLCVISDSLIKTALSFHFIMLLMQEIWKMSQINQQNRWE